MSESPMCLVAISKKQAAIASAVARLSAASHTLCPHRDRVRPRLPGIPATPMGSQSRIKSHEPERDFLVTDI